MRKELGKIKSASFGWGGYQDVMLGFSVELGGDGWGVCDFWGNWGTERTEYTKWSEEERLKSLGETVMRLKGVFEDAKVTSVHKLAGIPVEVTFDGNKLESWRVLKEVL
jgi:hypothetical protein